MRPVLPLSVLLAFVAPCALAQHHGPDHPASRNDSVAVMATGLMTRVSPAVLREPRTDLLITQPMLAARGTHAGGAFQYTAVLNFERWTMPGGEPVAGIWGEGFIDRRHPHTVWHEAMVIGNVGRHGPVRASLAAGKGFVSFGTDDPMVRPFTKFPANHHLSQIMERVQIVASARVGRRVAIEGTLFNGDEPASPTAAPQWARFGDSRAARLTVWPVETLELQGSVAAVRSPEFIRAEGLDHRKASASARWTPARGGTRYLQLEWAQTDELYRQRAVITYGTVLAEAAWSPAGWMLAARAERTSRPEEERLLDPFRSSRPPNHLILQGMTRWTLATVHVGRPATVRHLDALELFAEATLAHSTPLMHPVLLDPRNISGADVAWHLTAGLRVARGAMSARAGRYGVAAGAPRTQPMLGMAHSHHEVAH